MKLEATVKWLLNIKKIKSTLWVIVFLCFIFNNAKSQEFKLSFGNKETLSEALLLSSRTFDFKVAFDARRLNALYAEKEVSGNTQGEFITNLLKNSELTFIFKHGSYLIIEKDSSQPGKALKECQLSGSVSDYDTREQLPFASVILADQNINSPASTNGTFIIKNIISNPIHLTVSYIGYFPIDTLISWDKSHIELTFRLKQRVNKINPVEIKGDRIEMVDYRGDVDFATIINPSKLIDLPVLAETDIFRTLQLLPGISYSENSSELSIRGGTSDQNLVLFDGQTLYNLSHYYGVFSSINPNIVKDIQVFKGGFDSRYGERISGIIDITGKSGNQLKPAVSADINLLSINLALEIPLSNKLTLVAAGRRSYSDIYKTSFSDNLFSKSIPVLKTNAADTIIVSEPSFYFYDLNGKLNYRVSKNENISVSIYGGKDFFNNSYTYNSRALYVSNADTNTWHNYGISANWQKQWNGSLFSSLMVSSSGYTNDSENKTSIDRLQANGHERPYLPDNKNVFNTHNNNELKDWAISLRNDFLIDNFNMLNFGILLRRNDIAYYKDADKVYIYDNTRQSAWISSVYGQDRISLFTNLILKPGFRITYYNGNRKLYFEPRFAAKYNFSDRFSLRLATGEYTQFISQVVSQQETSYNKNFWVLGNDSVNPVLKAFHLITGAAYNRNNILFDIECYYKQYTGLQEYIYLSQFLRNTEFGKYFPGKNNTLLPPASPNKPSYFINGSGKSYGVDFFVRYKSRYYTSWISYSISKNKQIFDSINQGAEIPSLTDQTHQFSFTNLVTVGKWNFGSTTLFSTGRPYIAGTQNQPGLPVERIYQRMPDFFRMDLSANYSFLIKNLRLKTGISVINLFNTSNYFDINTRKFDFENTSFSETNLIRSQSLSLNLFFHINF
jgi:ferric enterobactin receptor